MRDKKLKKKASARAPHPDAIEMLRDMFRGDECRVQFVLWSDGVHLDVAGIYDDSGPLFRPAACAWEAWKAAWAFKDKERR